MTRSSTSPRAITNGWLAGALALATLAQCPAAAEEWSVSSPNGQVVVRVSVEGPVSYRVELRGETLVSDSEINLRVRGRTPLAASMRGASARRTAIDEVTRFVVPRKFGRLPHRCNQLELTAASGACSLVFRAYDAGVAFRWETNFDGEVYVEDERAEFAFPGEPVAWFPEEESMFSHQERVYVRAPLNEIGPQRFCSTGMLVETSLGPKVFISESDLASFPGMFLRGSKRGDRLIGKFAPYPLETRLERERDVLVTKAADYLAKTGGRRSFPWRVLAIAERDADLLTSELVYQLASPCALEETDWIHPGKVAWDWWNSLDVTGVDFRAGVNTDTYKHYVDFAAENNLRYIILDEGWSRTPDVLTVTEGLDLPALMRHAENSGVGVILWVLWHELDEHLVEALDWYASMGVAGIKVDFMQRDDQPVIEFYHRVAREAAKRKLVVDFHGGCKPFGLRRTYPNVLSFESVTGLEQYKWSDSVTTPGQELVLPFIRMVAGPMDYTPGAMDNATREDFRDVFDKPMSQGTRCHQLAMYVVYESPLQMLADSPTRYKREPECMRFLSNTPTVWDDTRVLLAEIGECVAIARRSGDAWFVAAMTNWTPRELALDLSFLPSGEYVLESWADGVNADRNATDFRKARALVSQQSELQVHLGPGGGWVGWLRPARRP